MTEEGQHVLAASVSKPEHQGVGRSKVTDYLVTTKYPKAESLVRRQLEDFQWVQKRLVEERAGIIVPVLSSKKPTNITVKYSEEFVQERQEALDRFLQRVINHPELVDAPSLLPFFTANPTDWKLAKQKAKKFQDDASSHSSSHSSDNVDPNSIVINAEDAVQQKKKGVLGKWWGAKKDNWALRNKNVMLEESPSEGKKFQDMQEYAEHLETCVRILAEDSKQLAQTSKSQAGKFQTMGAAFTQLWGEHELSNTSSSTMYQTIGSCWTTICKQVEEQVSYGRRHLETPLEELVLDVVALKQALTKRKATVYDYTKKAQEGRKLQVQMDKLKGVADLSQVSDQYYQMEHDIRASDAQVAESKKLKELVTSRLERDIERFRIEWHERMRQVLEDYHNAQVKFLQEQAKEWLKALPTLQEIDNNRAALPSRRKIENPELMISYSTSGAKASFGDLIPMDDHISYPVESAGPPPAAFPPPLPPSMSFDSVTLEESEAVAAPPAAAPPPPPPTSGGPVVQSV
jgi:hypothetical protein